MHLQQLVPSHQTTLLLHNEKAASFALSLLSTVVVTSLERKIVVGVPGMTRKTLR